MICNFEVYETKFCQYEYLAPELEAALKSGNRLPSNAAEIGRVDKAEKMSKIFLECGASHGSSLG